MGICRFFVREVRQMNKSKGSMEAEISKALTQWEKDYLGRGSVTVKTDIIRDMIIVSLRGVLTPAEYSLCESKEGMLTVKRTRSDLVESGIEDLKEIIFQLTGEKVGSFHTDISSRTGERVMVFKLFNDFEKNLMK
jgi:uncharacterized protein YbcI